MKLSSFFENKLYHVRQNDDLSTAFLILLQQNKQCVSWKNRRVPVKFPGGGRGPGHRLVRHLVASARLLQTSLHGVPYLSNAFSSQYSSPVVPFSLLSSTLPLPLNWVI